MNRQFDAHKMRSRIHEVGEPDQHRRHAHQTVQDGNQLRHFRHLHPLRQDQADAAANHQSAHQNANIGGDTRNGHHQGDGHADDAVNITAPRSFRVAQTSQRQNEKNSGPNIRGGYDSWIHLLASYLRNISSMRRVTPNPPAMLIAVISTANPANHMMSFSPELI